MTESSTQCNRRIAKNTLVLYVRMIFLMLVSLYTSRVTLDALGVTDYGIYNVVGGIVVILSFLNNAMSGATQRFLNFEMGKKNVEGLRRVFSSALRIYGFVAIVIFVLAESLGLWFLNSQMNIPPERMMAANWVYQFSLAAFLISVTNVPYNAAIIAHEKMSVFAYISIVEAILKLAVAFLIQITLYDRLIFYAFLIFVMGLALRLVYGVYCKCKFEECRYESKMVDKELSKKMLYFSSWTIFGNLGYVLHTQGIAVCVNIFFSAAVNAAQGISNTVNSAVSGFVSNFQMALNPQIVKSYAANQLDDMHQLIFRGCRYSFFLISIFAIPLIIEAPDVIGFWLKEVPEYTIIFVRLILLISVVNSFSNVLAISQGATGNVKKYQIVMTTVGAFHIPLTLLAFYLGMEPYVSSWIYLIIIIILQGIRISFVCRNVNISIAVFARRVLIPCMIVISLSSIIPFILHKSFGGGFLCLTIKCLISFFITAIVVYLIGMENTERQMIRVLIQKYISRIHK